MTHALPRTHFNSSQLVRTLSGLADGDVAESKQSFAERLGQWLDVTDAIALYAALNSNPAPGARAGTPGTPGTPGTADGAVQQEFERVRSLLAASIMTDGVFNAGRGRGARAMPGESIDANESGESGESVDSAIDFSLYHRAYRSLQRQMEAGVGPLRGQVRQAVARQCPTLRPLAEIDAALEKSLEARERHLLSRVPQLLEKRFERLREAHRQATPAPDRRNTGTPDGWLAVFRKDTQAVLLAELDVRLQPVAGLIEAFRNEVTKQR